MSLPFLRVKLRGATEAIAERGADCSARCASSRTVSSRQHPGTQSADGYACRSYLRDRPVQEHLRIVG
jgi:hypothetical protein